MERFACVSTENQERADTLEREICLRSAQVHALMARLAGAAAEFDEIGGWGGGGIRSFPHWLTIWAGFDPHTGGELLRVGQALRALPLLASAFGAGQVSFDKVRDVTRVATPETDEFMSQIARGATGSQLARICRSVRRMLDLERSEGQKAKRGLWTRLDEDGMMRLVAILPPEEGELVIRAIESIAASYPLSKESEHPAIEPFDARRADALVAMSEHVLSGGAPALVAAGEARQLVVHVDIGVLTGETPDGLCNLENGARLSAEAARRIGCDAEIIAVIERDGLPIDVGRKYRTAPPRLRRALEIRDRFCRFPGCCVPGRRAQAHHHDQWFFGGGSNLADMMLLCSFHHHRYHEGAYRIVKVEHEFRFETNDGVVIGAPGPVVVAEPPPVEAEAARAEWGGEHMDFDNMMWVLTDVYFPVAARAGPAN